MPPGRTTEPYGKNINLKHWSNILRTQKYGEWRSAAVFTFYGHDHISEAEKKAAL